MRQTMMWTLAAGLALQWDLSPLFVAVTMGALVANTSRSTRRVLIVLERWEKPVYVTFLLLAGALLQVPTWLVFPMAAAYVLLRFVAKLVGAAVLARAVPTQLVLGGFVSASYAGLACGTWPTCDGVTWFPTFSGLVGLQLVHRLMAYALLALALIGVVLFRSHPRLAVASRAFLLLVVVQGTLGVANVLLALPAEVTLAHTAGAASLMLCVAWLNYETWRAPVASVSTAPKSVPFALGKAP